MASPCAGVRSIEGRRARLPGLSLDELEEDESFRHMHKRAIVSKEVKESAGSDKKGEKSQKAKHFSRRLGLLLLLACATTMVKITHDGFVYGTYMRSRSEGADDFKDDVQNLSTNRAQESGGLIPGCTASNTSWKSTVFGAASGTSFSNCHLPKGASILSWMRYKYPHKGKLKIGLVNVGRDEQGKWKLFTRDWGKLYLFPFRSVSSLGLKWNDLYPEWIDEEEVSEIPKCPHIPLPSVSRGLSLDVVIAKVPGSCSGNESSRDVRRLQLMLAPAIVASKTQAILVMMISKCRPPLNLFTCNELLEVKDDVWLYQIDVQNLRKRLAVPVGSCELVLSPKKLASLSSGKSLSKESVRVRREAYATILHSDGVYVCGAIVMGQSIKLTDGKRDLIALVDAGITLQQRKGLELAGWKLHDIERIKNPKSANLTYNAWNYSKFRLWQLTQYDKIVFIDADLLVLQNLDALFDMPQLSATGNNKYRFNSGVMVIEPSNCTFDLLMQQINDVKSYNGGDQGFLNEIFPWWHRIPKRMNYLKYIWAPINSTEERRQEVAEKNSLFQADPPLLFVVHYLGTKPWTCFRDYDCNWNTFEAHKYASDIAHARWWKVHDSMLEELQQHCLLSTQQKAALELDRRQAEAANYEDQHWRINITDPRLQVCNESFCHWESMLRSKDQPKNQTQPANLTRPAGGQRKPAAAVGL
ncbi:hypothetical protein R1flu_000639 [Riccia fluitans]|uniref:Hexosyltransferase n=1 Tax=Riccia fluitans TaxID=41844 RepID=A0ABD1Y553_9MARC